MKPIVIVVCQKCEKRKRKGYGEVEADLLDEGLQFFQRAARLLPWRPELFSFALLLRARMAWRSSTELGHFPGLGDIDMFEKRVESSSIALAVE